MNKILLTLACMASIQIANADSFKFHQVRNEYIMDDGFGIPHTKIQKQEGTVEVNADEIQIDGHVYTRDERGRYRNERGRAVDLTLSYSGATLKNLRISTGHIVHQYDLEVYTPVNNIAQK